MLNKTAFLTITCTAAAFLALPLSIPAKTSAAEANSGYTAAASVPKLVLNGVVFHPDKDMDKVQPLYLGGKDGQTLFAPVRGVFEHLGYTLAWDESSQELIASKSGQTIRHKTGTTVWRVDDYIFNLDDASTVTDGTTWMPVESVCSSIGYRTVWNPLARTLYLKSSLAVWISDTLSGMNGTLTYDDRRPNGQTPGTGKLLLDGELWYEGELASGRPDGYGKLFEDGRLLYEGRFHGGQPDGKGTYYYPDGSRYIGSWMNGLQTGEGDLRASSGGRIYSGEWVNGVKQGFGRFYSSDGKMIYEGNVSQNKRNGHGVAFDSSGKKTYDGSWQSGVRTGLGKAYNSSGKIVYDGEWIDDRRNGSGRSFRVENMEWIYPDAQKGNVKKTESTTLITQETYFQDKLLTQGTTYAYTGEVMEDGTPNGKGILRIKTGEQFSSVFGIKDVYRDAFEGEYQTGQQTGYGKLYDDQNRLIYEGELLEGKRHGRGNAFEKGMLVFEGSWDHDRETDVGRRYTYSSGMTAASLTGRAEATVEEGRYTDGKLVEKLALYTYSGSFAGGMPNGYGTMTLMHDYVNSDGPKSLTRNNETGWLAYEGDFVNGLRNGKGKLFDKNKLVYEGDFVKGRREGLGKAYSPGSSSVYEGAFQNDLKNGFGRIFNNASASHTLLFEGSFRGDRKNGQGKLYYAESGNLQYEGSFKDDLKDGFGKLFYADGVTPYYQGEFRDDMTIDEFRNKNKQ